MQQVLVAEDSVLAAQVEVQHLRPTQQDLVAEERILPAEEHVQVNQQIDDPEDIVMTIDDKPKHVNPGGDAAVAGQTCSADKVGGENLHSHPESIGAESFLLSGNAWNFQKISFGSSIFCCLKINKKTECNRKYFEYWRHFTDFSFI